MQVLFGRPAASISLPENGFLEYGCLRGTHLVQVLLVSLHTKRRGREG